MEWKISLSCIILMMSMVTALDLFPVSIIHLNDMHARFDETNMFSNTCKSGDHCIGGFARVVSKVKELLVSRASKNPIYLNAADYYQGTIWYNLFKWNVTSYFLNMDPIPDAITIGNHEFDDGIAGLVPFMQRSRSPILISNIDDSLEPTFQGQYAKSTVITKYGRPIGIIGVTTTFRSNWGNVNILPEAEAVRVEAERLTAEGVKIIIVLSHCGLDPDREIAKFGGPIDIIVGGHSHSFLWSGDDPPGPDSVVDNYPVVEKQDNGRDVLIVQASAYTKYLGDIVLYFDEDGIIQDYEGAPIFLGTDVSQDPAILEELEPWKAAVASVQDRVIGNSKFDYSSTRCYTKECGMGSLTADANAYAFFDSKDDGWTGATVALANPGGIRAGLAKGEIIYGDLITTTPFENSLHSVELQGKFIREALEFSVVNEHSLMLLQVSGLRVVYNMENPPNSRVASLDVLCRVCDIPHYAPIEDETFYRVVMPSFLAGGGDGFTMIGENAKNVVVGPLDIEALTSFVQKNSPIGIPPLTGRISFI